MTTSSVAQLDQSPGSKPRYKTTEPLARLLADIPDTILWDPVTLEYAITPEVKRGRPPVCSAFLRCQLYRWLMVTGGSLEAIIPDVLLAQLIWGARTKSTPWPKRWRQKLKALAPFQGEWTEEGSDCPTRCPIRGCGVPHGHFRHLASRNVLGKVAGIAVPQGTTATPPVATLDFKKAKEVKGLRAVYLLPLLFAATPKSKITPRQGLLLSRLVGQVTRTRARVLQTRPDKAQVFTATGGALAGDDSREYQLVDCPFLTKGQRYVAFNGNRTEGRMKNKPHGYGLKVGTRAKEAGYPTVSAYLDALKGLVATFDLVAGGFDPSTLTWYTLDQLKALGNAGKDFLLRVYGPADYREEWRAIFYGWLGFDPLHAAVRVASDAEVKRVRARTRSKQKSEAKAEAPAPVVPSTAPPAPPPAPVAPPAPPQRPDLIKVRTDLAALVADVEARTKSTFAALLPSVKGDLVRGADLPVLVKYVAMLRLVPGWEGQFLDGARADYKAHPAEWAEFLREEAEKDAPDGHVRRAVAKFPTPAPPQGEGAPSSSAPATPTPETGTSATTATPQAPAPSPSPRSPTPPTPAPTAAVSPPATDTPRRLDPDQIRLEYEALLAKARSRIAGRSGLVRQVELGAAARPTTTPAVIRYAVTLTLDPEVAVEHLDQARDEYSADPALWGQFLEEQAQRDGPDSPLRQAASLLAATAA